MTESGDYLEGFADSVRRYAANAPEVFGRLRQLARLRDDGQDVREELDALLTAEPSSAFMYLAVFPPQERQHFWERYGNDSQIASLRGEWEGCLASLADLVVEVNQRVFLQYINRWTQVVSRAIYDPRNRLLRSELQILSGSRSVAKMLDDPGSIARLAVLLLRRVSDDLSVAAERNLPLTRPDLESMQDAATQLRDDKITTELLNRIDSLLSQNAIEPARAGTAKGEGPAEQ